MADGDDSVKVAVRMRLFNGREKTAGANRIVRMANEQVGSKTYITNPDTGDEKSFAFDYSFQSHSMTEENIGPWADQDTVFTELGKPVLYCALEGRNVCLFAYGQTGAGKSFSMLGKAEPAELQGIIPRSCHEIFRLRDLERDDPCVSYDIEMQVVEIYCEMINDLLDERKNWPANGHKPRLTKDGYVVDTVCNPCFCYADIEKSFSFADKNRSVGSHALNPESSRAHTIYTICYKRQKKTSPEAKQAETITSRINLVDLAGSERSESAGTTGQMLKEGNAINLSLTALGSTIKALSEGKRPNFRDSKLTLLLQGAMTNGKVIMIAAVSPASICYDESMSTLRFAERIKMVKIKAKKNVTQDPVAEIKKEMEEMRQKMQEEIDLLRETCGGAPGAGAGKKEEELRELLESKKEAEKQLKEDYERQLRAMDQTPEERQKRGREINKKWDSAFGGASSQKTSDVKEPHLRNLNEDTRLAETLVYALKPGITKIGRSDKSNPPDFEFNGMGITKEHCFLEWEQGEEGKGGKVFITAKEGKSSVLNGHSIKERTELQHNNRLWLGNNYAFRFVFPGMEEQGEQFKTIPDYLFAEAEIAAASQSRTSTDGIPTALGHKLSEALKKVEQANIIAQDLDTCCEFYPKIVKDRETEEDAVSVQVRLPEGLLLWPWDKFADRLLSMVTLWQSWQQIMDRDGGTAFTLPPKEQSPFHDFEDQLIGEADVWLQALGNMLDSDTQVPVMDPCASSQGKLSVSISPLDVKGKEGPWGSDDEDDPFVDEPSELLNKKIQFLLKVKQMDFQLSEGKPKFKCVWIRYKLHHKDFTEPWQTSENSGDDPVSSAQLNFSHKHELEVTPEFVKHLEKGFIRVQVWGKVVADSAPVGKTAAETQTEVHSLLKEMVPECPDSAGIPEGWIMIPLFQDAEGVLHHKLPEAVPA